MPPGTPHTKQPPPHERVTPRNNARSHPELPS